MNKYLLEYALFENILQAKKILKGLNISETDPDYLKIKKLVNNKFGYLGKFVDMFYNDGVSFEKLSELYDTLENSESPKYVKIDKPLDSFKTDGKSSAIEKIEDYLNILRSKNKNNWLLSYMTPNLKKEFRENIELLNKLGNLTSDLSVVQLEDFGFRKPQLDPETNKLVYSKMKGYKNAQVLLDGLTTYIENLSGKNSIINNSKKFNINIVYNQDNYLVIKINNFESSKNLGTTDWCIVRDEYYWKSVVGELNTQYFMWDFNKEFDDDNYLIGVTISPNGNIKTAHAKKDKYVDFKAYITGINVPLEIFKPIEKSELVKKLQNGNITLTTEYLKKDNRNSLNGDEILSIFRSNDSKFEDSVIIVLLSEQSVIPKDKIINIIDQNVFNSEKYKEYKYENSALIEQIINLNLVTDHDLIKKWVYVNLLSHKFLYDILKEPKILTKDEWCDYITTNDIIDKDFMTGFINKRLVVDKKYFLQWIEKNPLEIHQIYILLHQPTVLTIPEIVDYINKNKGLINFNLINFILKDDIVIDRNTIRQWISVSKDIPSSETLLLILSKGIYNDIEFYNYIENNNEKIDLDSEMIMEIISKKLMSNKVLVEKLISLCEDGFKFSDVIDALKSETSLFNKDEMINLIYNNDKMVSIPLVCDVLRDNIIDNKTSIIKLFDKVKNELGDYNQYAYYQLYKNQLIDKNKFVESFSDLKVVDNEIKLVFDDWDHIESLIVSDEQKASIEVLNGEYDHQYNSYDLEDIYYVWDNLTKETKQEVINAMEGIEFYLDDAGDNFIISKKNVVYVENKDFYFKYKIDKNIIYKKIADIIEDGKTDEFQDIFSALDSAYDNCQNNANENEMYDNLVKSIESVLGKFEQKQNGTKRGRDGKEEIHYSWFVDIDLSGLEDALYNLYVYNNVVDYESEEYSDIIGILSQGLSSNDMITFDEPYYGFNGDITPEDMNERVSEKISEL